MAAALQVLKRELRQRARSALSALSSDPGSTTQQTSKVTETLLNLEQYRTAKRISVYLSMPRGEISTDEIVYDALGHGKQVFVPHTYKSTEGGKPIPTMDMLELQSPQDFTSFQPDKWGIPTASERSVSTRLNCFGSRGKSEEQSGTATKDQSSGGLDLIVVPGLFFDWKMGRLGHGAGFYDRFLSRYESHCKDKGTKMPFLVALALNEQLLPANESVPMDATDWRVDAVIMGDGTLHQKQSSR